MEHDSKIKITGCRTNTSLTDHYSIIIDTNIKKNKPNIVKNNQEHHKTITNTPNESYIPSTFKPKDTIDQVYNQFKEDLIKMLDVVAPPKKK